MWFGSDRGERGVGRHPLEDRTAEGADAGAVFDEQFGVRPIYGTEHLADQPIGGRDDRADQDRKSVVLGKSVSVRVELGGRRIIKKKNNEYDFYKTIT